MAAPTLSRRHAAGAESARGLLFTVLGEFVLPSGGSALTSAFIDVLGRLGVEEKATRQALMRTAADGWLTSCREGRRTRWALTTDAEHLLRTGAERIYGFHGVQRGWDGHWLLVLARSSSETDRRARRHLSTRLSWAGLGQAAPGVWISTHVERLGEVTAVLGQAEHQIFVAEHRDGELPTMVNQAWDLDRIEDAYRGFIAAFGERSADDALGGLVELVHAWRRFPLIDPELPPQLLPATWSGERAAALFHKDHDASTSRANDEWHRVSLASV